MKMKKVGVTLKVTEETKRPFHNLNVIFNKEPIASLEQVQHFLECHGMSIEANALSSAVDRIAAVAMKSTKVQTLGKIRRKYWVENIWMHNVLGIYRTSFQH